MTIAKGRHTLTHKEAERWIQWTQQTCAVFPVITDIAEATSKHMHNIALWQQARVTLIQIFHLHSHHDSTQMRAIRNLLHRLGISPKAYTFAHHNANSIVYLRFTLDRQFSKFKYIGCSQHNLRHGEASRNRKHKQVQEHKIVHAELAIRWRAKNNNYHRFVPITIQHSIAEEQLEAVETAYKQQLQPKLNHPYIAPYMRRSLRLIHRQGRSKATGFRSIWAKIRRKMLPPKMQDIYSCHTFTSQVDTWTLLCDLSSNTKRRFDGIRNLLKSQTSTTGIYGLCRMANNMSNVHKQAAIKALKVVLRKRRLQAPKPSKPILVQPLMHPQFTANLRNYLKQAISKHKDHIPPFFIPSTRPVFTKHRTMKDVIHNWREAHRRWHPDHCDACTCQLLAGKFPECLHNGHIAIELCKVAPDMQCPEYSGKSNVLPDRKSLTVQLRKAIQTWHRSNGLPIPKNEEPEMTDFIQQQLTEHEQHATHTHTLNMHMLKALQERLPAGIVHCEDHFADRLIWYCPMLYHKCISGTFMNAEVFQTSEHQPLLLHEATYQRMLKRLPKHKWAFPNWGRIPTAYILPKRKKDFAMGRPIVSFVQAQGRSLWESFADVLYLMIRQACPDAMGEGSGILQLHQIKQHFSELSARMHQEPWMTNDVTCVNQDLAGFFTSISSDRFLDSYHLLLHWYQQNNTRHATTFTVAHSESLPDARVHRGSHRHMSHTTTTRLHRRSLHIQEFPNIISSILELNYFMVGQGVLRQIRGAPMGSPASPALCSMVVAVHEQAWAITYKTHLFNAKH